MSALQKMPALGGVAYFALALFIGSSYILVDSPFPKTNGSNNGATMPTTMTFSIKTLSIITFSTKIVSITIVSFLTLITMALKHSGIKY